MPFNIERFANIRPFLYHLTSSDNLAHICSSRAIAPAIEWMKRAGRLDLLRQRRTRHEPLLVDDFEILLRDQKPLIKNNIAYAPDYTFEELVETLNRRVFFWPGKPDKPERTGRDHFDHYRDEQPVIIRAEFHKLLADNPGIEPLFCKYNSGSPRIVNRKKSPRGPNTFVRPTEFPGTACEVIEVTFAGPVSLPLSTEICNHPEGPWRPLSV